MRIWRKRALEYQAAVDFTEQEADLWLREGLPNTRTRWITAHMLGHLCLHSVPGQHWMFDENVVAVGDVYAEHEEEANDWAAELLIPEWLLKPILGTPVAEIAEIFDVSYDLMLWRLRALYPGWYR